MVFNPGKRLLSLCYSDLVFLHIKLKSNIIREL